MGITDIANQKTPARPVEITFAPELGLPSANQTVVLIGHAATGVTGINSVVSINNSSDPVAGLAEAQSKFGVGSELTAMVLAAIEANAATGAVNFPTLKAIPLLNGDTGFGSGAALNALNKIEAEFIVSPYDGQTDSTNTTAIINQAQQMSGAQRVENGQYGTFAVSANQSVSDPSTLLQKNTLNFIGIYRRDTSSPVYSVGQLAAAAAAVMAGNAIPFNPLDNVVLGDVPAPTLASDVLSIGAGLESETVLNQGWTPLRTFANGTVGFVRTVTSRLFQSDGITPVNAYYDVQDHQVLFFFRKTVKIRESQPDFSTRKASVAAAQDLLSEIIRLATAFQDQNMFQAVDKLTPQFIVQRSSTDRHRFDVFIPVNVIPGLHVIANNINAGTQFDSFSL